MKTAMEIPADRLSNRSAYKGPNYTNLSEPLQNDLVAFLYECGVRPEIGLAVEYLSWNKEQRLYMKWLQSMYKDLCDEDSLAQLN